MEEGFEFRLARFCHDFAAFIAVKAIDHHPVETEQGFHLPRCLLAQGIDFVDCAQPCHDGAQDAGLVPDAVGIVRFDFENDVRSAAMQREIEHVPSARQPCAEDPFDMVLVARYFHVFAQHVCRFGRDVIDQPVAHGHRACGLQEIAQICRNARDVAIAGQRDQRTEILNMP